MAKQTEFSDSTTKNNRNKIIVKRLVIEIKTQMNSQIYSIPSFSIFVKTEKKDSNKGNIKRNIIVTDNKIISGEDWVDKVFIKNWLIESIETI